MHSHFLITKHFGCHTVHIVLIEDFFWLVWLILSPNFRIAEYHLNQYKSAHAAFTQGQQLDGEWGLFLVPEPSFLDHTPLKLEGQDGVNFYKCHTNRIEHFQPYCSFFFLFRCLVCINHKKEITFAFKL